MYSFRTTATYDQGYYSLVDEYYQVLGSYPEEHVDLDKYNASHITLDEFYLNTAHRLQDLVQECSWGEEKFSISEFVRVLTDYGVCYTFNSGRHNGTVREVSRTGAGRGLKLRLNIEQYEYMVGPNPGAGIKILLHENNEIPLVRDLGLAIPPGSHAYVGVQILEVNNLPEPWGKCNDTAQLEYHEKYGMSACGFDIGAI